MSDKPIILFGSPECAHKETRDAWVSRNGWVYFDERAAMYDGCTHVKCSECGRPTEKSWTACQICRDKKDTERFLARPKAKWDGKAMVYSETLDRYFQTPGDAFDWIDENEEEAVEDLRLIICEPNYATEIDSSIYESDLAEDGELPSEIQEAIDNFNKSIKNAPPISWSPGKFALDLS